MITNNNSKRAEYVSLAQVMELIGLSTDTKPLSTFEGVPIGENSTFLELDTGDLYYLSAGTWKLFGSAS